MKNPNATIDFKRYMKINYPHVIGLVTSFNSEKFKTICKQDKYMLSGKISFVDYISSDLVKCILELKPDFDFSHALKEMYEYEYSDDLVTDLIYIFAEFCELDYSAIIDICSNLDHFDLKLFDFVLSKSSEKNICDKHGYAYWVNIDILKIIEKHCDIYKWIMSQSKITERPFVNDIIQYIYHKYHFIWPEEYINCLMNHDQHGNHRNNNKSYFGHLLAFIKLYPETKISATKFMTTQRCSNCDCDTLIDIMRIIKFI